MQHVKEYVYSKGMFFKETIDLVPYGTGRFVWL